MTTLGPHYDADAPKTVPELYWKQLLHLFPTNGIVSYREVISSPFYVHLK